MSYRRRQKSFDKEKMKKKINIEKEKKEKKEKRSKIKEEKQEKEKDNKEEMRKEEKKKIIDIKKIRKRPSSSKSNVREKSGKISFSLKGKSLFRKILTIILGMGVIGVASILLFFIYIVISCGNFDPEALKNQEQTVIYDKDGGIIATLGDQKREEVDYDELPQVLIDAIIATEDSRFFQHNGVDTARFLKATALQLIGRDEAGGASTLTMQTVKNNLTKKDQYEGKIQKLVRKFKDVYLSVFFMEKRYTKEEILEMYVNDSGLGGMIYGVGEASKYYFGKSVSELSLPEASLLAGMYQAPSRYNPYTNPDNAKARRSIVLKLMEMHGYITKEEHEMAEAVSIESMLVGTGQKADYQGYIDTVIEEVETKTGNNPAQVSMKIYTALDRDVQDGINKVLNGEVYKNWADDVVQAGVAVTNVNDGTIIAIGAGRNRQAGDWNYATQSHRQPGSTAKPIFDYGPGFEFNNYSTYTLFNDEPWAYSNGGPAVGNWDGNYQGLITLKQAVSVSRNVPALKAFQQVDKKNIAQFANGLGLDIAYSTSSSNYKKYDNGADNLLNEAYAIGGLGYGVTPLEMAEAYGCFANGGYHIDAHTVTKIEYRSTGEVVEFNPEKERVMADSTAYLMNNVLSYAVAYGFDGGAKAYGSSNIASKTGTSNLDEETKKAKGLPMSAINDLWTVAYTPEHAIALWYGYAKIDSEHYLGGASYPKDHVMAAFVRYLPKTNKQFEVPSSVVQVTVEKETWPAQRPSAYTPADMKTTEYFKKGTQPTEVSQRYEKFDEVTSVKQSETSKGIELSWTWKEPDVLNEDYLKKYFSNSVYGNGSSAYLERRIKYNNETLGGQGFGIYEKSSSGELKRIAFTKEKSYTYKPTKEGNITLVIKAEYGTFKDNASSGVEVKVNVKEVENYTDSNGLKVTLLGDRNIVIDKAKNEKYVDSGISITYDNKDVTKDVTITYLLDSKPYDTKADLEKAVNELNDGTHQVKYKVSYKKDSTSSPITTTSLSRSIIITKNSSDDQNKEETN